MAGRPVDNIEELDVLTYDGLRLRVGPTSDEELSAQAAGGHHRWPEHVVLLLGHITDRNLYSQTESRHLPFTGARQPLAGPRPRPTASGGATEGRQATAAHRLDQHAVGPIDGDR